MMKKLLLLGMLNFLTLGVFAQNTNPSYIFVNPTNPGATKDVNTSTYEHFLLDVDLTPKFDTPAADPTKVKADNYFMIALHKDNKIYAIANYDKNKKLSNFLLDREFNVYFAYIKAEYKAVGQNISKMILYDTNGQQVSYIEYIWEEKPAGSKKYLLRTANLFQYSSLKRDFVMMQSRRFIYGGGAFGKGIGAVHWSKGNGQAYGQDVYGNTPKKISYTRYDEKGEVQYSRNLSYNGNDVSEIQTYNKEGVLVSDEKPAPPTVG